MPTDKDRRAAVYRLHKAESDIDLREDASAIARLESAIGLLAAEEGDNGS